MVNGSACEVPAKTRQGHSRHLQPNVAYMRLFREVVLDCWKDRQVGAMRLRTAAERRMAKIMGHATPH